MSTRAIALTLLALATSGLAACADVTGPTSRSSIAPSARPSLDVGDSDTCRTGGWNSSTGRCE